MEHETSENKISKFLSFFGRNSFVLVAVVLVFVAFRFLDNRYASQNSVGSAKIVGTDKENNSSSGDVKGETSTNLDGESPSSENYRLAQVTFGGDIAVSHEEMQPLEVSDVKSELVVSKNKKDIRLVVSWKTNKLAKGEIDFGKNGDVGAKAIKEDSFSSSHSLTLTSLDPATAYSFVVVEKDKWGNEKKSDKFAFYTGAPDVSLIDLLTGAARESFGWAIGK